MRAGTGRKPVRDVLGWLALRAVLPGQTRSSGDHAWAGRSWMCPVRAVRLRDKFKEGRLASEADTTDAGEQRTRDARSPQAREERSALAYRKLLQYLGAMPVATET